MHLRNSLELDLNSIENRYIAIMELFGEFYTERDESDDAYTKRLSILESKVSSIVNKDVSNYTFHEPEEEEGIDVLAFRLSLPPPPKVTDFTYEEIVEIVNRIKIFEYIPYSEGSFSHSFRHHFSDYYHELLKINLKNYEYKYFNRQKDQSGNYYEFSSEDVAKLIKN